MFFFLFFLFFDLGSELEMSLFSFWFRKSYGCFCVHDSDDPSYIAYFTLTYVL
jgi:hypothetical protein